MISSKIDIKRSLGGKLRYIVNHLCPYECKRLGLFNGKMGMVIFLFHYARYIGGTKAEKAAYNLLLEIYEHIQENGYVNFIDLSEIGRGIEYIVKQRFIEADTDEILEDIDQFLSTCIYERKLYISLQELFDLRRYFIARLANPKTKKTNELQETENEIEILIRLHVRINPASRNEVLEVKLIDGYPCLGLALLSAIDPQHNTWIELI
jgi:hypothetical protein